MRKYLKTILASVLLGFTTSAGAINHDALVQYASSLKGLKKEQLKQALHELMRQKDVLDYGSGKHNTWYGFWYTDRDPKTSECINRYSDRKFYFGSTNIGRRIDGMNIEHSFPKSWWGGVENDAWCDLYNLYPSDSKANSDKSNYIMGVVTQVKSTAGEGYDKVGSGYANGQLVRMWEPGDRFKGEFSRSYMYMATTYQDLNFTSEGVHQLVNGAYPTLQKWSSDLFRQWSRNDRVDSMEVARNNAVAKLQQNRNLYIDFPNLCEYVWGDSMEVAFNPETSLSTASDDGRYMSVTTEPGENPDEPQVGPQNYIFVKTTTAPEAGKRYILVVDNGGQLMAANTVAAGRKYDYLKTTNVTEQAGKIALSANDAVFMLEQSAGGYYIKDSQGRYFYQDGSHKNFNVVTDVTKASEWTVEPKGDGTFDITTTDAHFTIQYSTQYKSFGAYADPQAGALYPMLYVEDAEATGISAVMTGTVTDEAVYSLQGIRQPSGVRLQPGIYVRGGRKFIVR
ncbi:MAG: endonuclease [Prevotella sp.]|nr:endonuclease [Prevotella sp.]